MPTSLKKLHLQLLCSSKTNCSISSINLSIENFQIAAKHFFTKIVGFDIWFLHQNPDSPKNAKKCYEFGFVSTFELPFLCKDRFRFVHWHLNRKRHTYSGGFGLNIYFEPCVRILKIRDFQKILWRLIELHNQNELPTSPQAWFFLLSSQLTALHWK